MRVDNLAQAKAMIGQRLYWDEFGNRYVFIRSGILTEVFRRQLMFDESFDYKPLRDYRNLRTTYEPE